MNRNTVIYEAFHVYVTYKENLCQFGIIQWWNGFNNCIFNEVWEDGSYVCTLLPWVDQDMNFIWRDNNTLSALNNDLVSAIGEAIEDHDE